MEWEQLQRFLVIAQEENLSKAAKILHTSQPSLSQIIKRMEEELGYSLFEREGKNIRLNESGKIFLQTTRQIDELMKNTLLQLEEKNHIAHPEVTLYFATVSTMIPELLQYLKNKNPDIRYKIHQWAEGETEADGEIQILMKTLERPLGMTLIKEAAWSKHERNKLCDENEEDLLQEQDIVLFVEDIVLALPQSHELVKKEKIFMKDLVFEEFISLNERWGLEREIKKKLDELMIRTESNILVDNPSIMRELLKMKMGLAFVPAVSWYSFIGNEISLRRVEDFQLSRMIYLHTKPGKYQTKEQKECVKMIQEFFSKKIAEIQNM